MGKATLITRRREHTLTYSNTLELKVTLISDDFTLFFSTDTPILNNMLMFTISESTIYEFIRYPIGMFVAFGFWLCLLYCKYKSQVFSYLTQKNFFSVSEIFCCVKPYMF